MLSDYIAAAMNQAKYKVLSPNEYFGEIKACPGVWASTDSLESCRDALKSALEDWLLFSLQSGFKVPVIGRVDLNRRKKPARAKVA